MVLINFSGAKQVIKGVVREGIKHLTNTDEKTKIDTNLYIFV